MVLLHIFVVNGAIFQGWFLSRELRLGDGRSVQDLDHVSAALACLLSLRANTVFHFSCFHVCDAFRFIYAASGISIISLTFAGEVCTKSEALVGSFMCFGSSELYLKILVCPLEVYWAHYARMPEIQPPPNVCVMA